MVVDSGRMTFFFGAGTSAEFGIPLMRKMGEDFKSIINKQGLEQQEIYNEIVDTLKDDMGPDVDIVLHQSFQLSMAYKITILRT